MNPILTTTVAVVTISIFATLSCRNVTNQKVETPAEKAFRELPNIIERSPIEKVAESWNSFTATNAIPVTAKGCKDGNYEAQSPADDYQYVHKIKLKVKNGLITRVYYDELRYGIGKRNNEEYCQQMSASGTTPAIAYPNYEEQLLSKQNLDKVDAVSGATYSLYRFRYVAAKALYSGQQHK